MKALYRLSTFVATLLALVVLACSSAARADFVVGDFNGDHLIRRSFTVANGQWITAQTTGCSGSADTVIVILEGNMFTSGNMKTAYFNDDDGFSGTFCSYALIQNTSGVTKNYTVLVTTYNPNTPANVSLLLQLTPNAQTTESVTVGGVPHRFGGNGSGETIQVVPTRPANGGHYVDSVLYVIDPTTNATSRFDDDSGFSYLSKMTNLDCTNKTCWMIAGDYSEGTAGGNLEIWSQGSSADSDGDGISDSIEDTLGTIGHLPANSKNNVDADGDGLSDFVELVGVPAASLSGYDTSLAMPWQDADATRQDVFMQIDYMTATGTGAHNHLPYGCPSTGLCTPSGVTALGNDMVSLFQNDSTWTTRTIVPHVEVLNSLTETATIGFSTCAAAGYSKFYDYKNNVNFFDPLRSSVYHYVIAGHQERDGSCNVIGASGDSEILGNDFMVNLVSGSTLQMRGTYVHELGHNLSLTHNGNGQNSGANSCVHTSVMNYRYQLGGWGNASTPTLRKQAYSRGSCDAAGVGCGNTCAANRCVPNSQTSPKQGCGTNNGSCDCDTSEWTAVNLNFPRFGDDKTTYHSSGASSGFSPMADYFRGNKGGLGALHHQFAERKRQHLKDAGLKEGVDFYVDPDTHKIFAIE